MIELLTVAEVAARLRISPRSTWRLIHAGRLRVVNPIPGRTLITSRELEAYIASLVNRKVA